MKTTPIDLDPAHRNFRPSAYLLAALQSVRDSVPQLATA